MFENNVEFRVTDFSQVVETNSLFKQFYKTFNYNKDDRVFCPLPDNCLLSEK